MARNTRHNTTMATGKRKRPADASHHDEPESKKMSIKLVINSKAAAVSTTRRAGKAPTLAKPRATKRPAALASSPDFDCDDEDSSSDDDGEEDFHIQDSGRQFRLRPSTKKSALLSRRSTTSAFKLTGNTIIATEANTVNLITPPPSSSTSRGAGCSTAAARGGVAPMSTIGSVDSGYCTIPSSSPPGGPRTAASTQRAVSPSGFVSADESDNCQIASVREYKKVMHKYTDKLFMKKVVRKDFSHDPKKAREDLRPIMAHMLDPPATMAKTFWIVETDKNGHSTIHTTVKTVRLPPRKPGERAVDMSTTYYEDYLEAGRGHNDN